MPQFEEVDFDPFQLPDVSSVFDPATYGPKDLTLQDLLVKEGRRREAQSVTSQLLGTEGYAPSGPRTETKPEAQRSAVEKLLGIGGERYPIWLERIVRSGVTLASDMLRGAESYVPGQRREDVTDIPPSSYGMFGTGLPGAQPNDRVIERTQDLAGLMAGGSIPAAERGALGTAGGRMTSEYGKIIGEQRAKEGFTTAIRDPQTGEIHVGDSHPDILSNLTDIPLWQRLSNEFNGQTNNIGYLDNKGRFISRGQAEGRMQSKTAMFRSDDIAGTGLAAAAIGGRVKQPTVAEATAYARELVAATGARWESFTPEQQAEWLRRSYDQIIAKRQKDLVENPAPTFYSAVERAVTNSNTKSASAEQWLNTLRNTPGVKKEELDWMGLDDWAKAQKGPVTKEALQAHLAEQGTKLEEVWKKGLHTNDAPPRDWVAETVDEFTPGGIEQFVDDMGREPTTAEIRQIQHNLEDEILAQPDDYGWNADYNAAGGTKYSEYQLPGGDNYREMLMTLPRKGRGETYSISQRPSMTTNSMYWDVVDSAGRRQQTFLDRKEAERFIQEKGVPEPEYNSSHWDEPNVLLHMRMNDRVIPDGSTSVTSVPKYQVQQTQDGFRVLEFQGQGKPFKVDPSLTFKTKGEADQWLADHPATDGVWQEPGGLKTLHMEELQSDWHQQGRKSGYKSDKIPSPHDRVLAQIEQHFKANYEGKSLPGGRVPGNWAAEKEKFLDSTEGRKLYDKLIAKEMKVTDVDAAMDAGGGVKVPDAPFKASWPELGLKRMIREAAENGYDAISWTPGEQQAARYDLSKHVNHIDVKSAPPGEAMLGTASDGSVLRGNKHVKIQGKSGVIGSGLIDNEGKILQGYDMLRDAVGKNLADVVGKDVAEKIIKAEGKETRLEGLDLSVGGEGMKAFYDKMLVDKANALAKKFGGKVEWTELPQAHDASHNTPFSSIDRANQVLDSGGELYVTGPRSGGEHHVASRTELEQFQNDFTGPYTFVLGDKQPSIKVPMLRITPAMRDAALGRGFPLYATGLPFAFEPVDHDPFKDEQK